MRASTLMNSSFVNTRAGHTLPTIILYYVNEADVDDWWRKWYCWPLSAWHDKRTNEFLKQFLQFALKRFSRPSPYMTRHISADNPPPLPCANFLLRCFFCPPPHPRIFLTIRLSQGLCSETPVRLSHVHVRHPLAAKHKFVENDWMCLCPVGRGRSGPFLHCSSFKYAVRKNSMRIGPDTVLTFFLADGDSAAMTNNAKMFTWPLYSIQTGICS